MSFDAHSLERLRELGRQLPQPLPAPAPSAGTKPRASEKRHTVELERDPEQLFRELMKVSPDGTVPPHLMDRLRSLEESRLAQQARERRSASSGQSAAPAAEATRRPGPGRSTIPRADPRLAAEHPDLYTAFHSLLLEDEEDD